MPSSSADEAEAPKPADAKPADAKPVDAKPAAKPRASKPTPKKARQLIDAQFAKRLTIANGLVPLALLAWDAYHRQLGVNEINFAIRTTGMVGLVLLVLSLAISPLRKLTGWSQLLAIRRNLGVLAFLYIAVHFALFFVFDRSASVTGALSEIVLRVYLWFGAAAFVAMIPLAVTSTDGMVRRLRQRWKQLHRLAYPIAVAAVIHYVLLVKSDVRQPLVFGVVLGGLLGWRVVQSANAVFTRRRARASKN
jgi:glycine betaine catabolism B